MPKNTIELTDALKATVLKHLINGRDGAFIATATGLTHDQVGDVKRDHGYPDLDKMDWALDILTKRAEKAATPTPSPHPTLTSTPPPARPAPPKPATLTPVPAAPVTSTTQDLLERGAKSSHARTRNLATKASDLLNRLANALDAEEKAKAAKAQEDAAEKKRKARIAELEAELAKLKTRSTTRVDGADPNTDPCEECGRTFPTKQGLSLHIRRAHEGYNPTFNKAASA